MDSVPDFIGILRAFAEADVDFVVIGGVGATLHGVPVTTFDLDLVLSHESEVLDRAHRVLVSLDACYRERLPARRLRPDRTDLESSGALLLLTRHGPLDILGSVSTGWAFPELIQRTIAVQLRGGSTIRVVDLPTLIEIKESVGREKDTAALPLYRRVLKEQSDRGGPTEP